MAGTVKADAGFERFTALCRRYGLKITPQRTAIYTALYACSDHPSADYVYRKVKRTFPNISFETVNRTMLTFAEIGLIAVVESTSGVRRFDPDMGDHHHLHCVRCGRIVDIRHEEFDRINVPESLRRQYRIIGKRVVLHVICFSCLAGNERFLPADGHA